MADRRLKVVCKGEGYGQTSVVDAETGEPIEGVVAVRFEVDARTGCIPVLMITVSDPLAEIECEAPTPTEAEMAFEDRREIDPEAVLRGLRY